MAPKSSLFIMVRSHNIATEKTTFKGFSYDVKKFLLMMVRKK